MHRAENSEEDALAQMAPSPRVFAANGKLLRIHRQCRAVIGGWLQFAASVLSFAPDATQNMRFSPSNISCVGLPGKQLGVEFSSSMLIRANSKLVDLQATRSGTALVAWVFTATVLPFGTTGSRRRCRPD